MRSVIILLLFGICAFAFFGSGKSEERNTAKGIHTEKLFSYKRAVENSDNSMQTVKRADIVGVDMNAVAGLLVQSPSELNVEIPMNGGTAMKLKLKRSYPLAEDFALYEKSGSITVRRNFSNEGIHFTGIIEGKDNTVAALSFFRDGVIGVISDEKGNHILGPLERDGSPSGEYVFYNDADLLTPSGFKCGVEDLEDRFTVPFNNAGATAKQETDNPARLAVRVYMEADFQTYLDKGSNIQNVANYISGLYNSVQAIYQAEGIPTQVSNVAVWTAADPYRNLTSSDSVLFAFGRNTQDNFQGNLAHLISTRSANMGGIAWIRVLCSQYEPSYFAGRFAFSNIETTYNNFPTYSWTINCITHEMGHNLGSRHTHSCTWPTGNGGALGPIDSCYYAEGGCFPAPRPRIGTIMSYCHLWPANQGGGVNLASGFGQLPGDTIRLRYAQASCLDREMNSSERPSGFDLAQNHPNPFNPTTTISFAVPDQSEIYLEVYDMAGRKITELISAKLFEPGFYSVDFDASSFGLSSGVYFYRLRAERFTETKRMALIK